MEQINAVVDSLRMFWLQLLELLPRLFAGILLLILGWLAARVIRKGVIRLLKFLRVDVVAEKAGIEDFLIQGGVQFTTVTIIGGLVYWFTLFAVILAVLNSLGLQMAAELFNRIILYIPNVVVAVIVLIFGTLFAKLIQGIAYTYLNNIGVGGARTMSTVAQYAILVFVISIALEQLAIGGQVLVSAFQIAFGALCLALALAFGLGGKEWAARMLDQVWKKTG